MRILFVLFLLAFSFGACKKKEERPAYVIPEEKFVRVLIDYNLAQAVYPTNVYRKKVEYYKEYSLIDTVFRKHGITRAAFDSTLSYYSLQPKKLEVIYDRVISEYRRRSAEIQDKIDKKQKAEQHIKKK